LVLQSVSASRLDVAIDLDNPDWIPVFVRMDKQLVNRSGDFERICIDRARFSRSQNRLEVSTILREQATHSWTGIEKFITKSISKKQIREVNRFWIVNALLNRVLFKNLSTVPMFPLFILTGFSNHFVNLPLCQPSNCKPCMIWLMYEEEKAPVFPEV
jgi:hypothetical protein